VAGDEKEEAAAAPQGAPGRDQQRRYYWAYLSAASYAIDALFLCLFAAAGSIAWTVVAAYALAAAAACLVQQVAYRSGWNLARRDPNLTLPFIAVATALQLSVVAAAPQIAFPYLVNLFTVFAFGMIWLQLRDSLLLWSAGVVSSGALFYFLGERLGMPMASALERGLVWAYFSLVLGRSLYLSVHASEMRSAIERSRARLAASLKQIEQLVQHDELTGTHNRRALVARLEQERSRADRVGAPFSVALFDLDHFKRVNDSLGHAAGDEALKGFVRIVHATMRDTDFFGRYGGEEFLMLLTDTPPSLALGAAERIRVAVEGCDWPALAPGLALTVSCGVTGWNAEESVEQVLHRADMAMYEAKRAGRNCVRVM
jgi:diguanylate cyclase (GGDEF)-like protein